MNNQNFQRYASYVAMSIVVLVGIIVLPSSTAHIATEEAIIKQAAAVVEAEHKVNVFEQKSLEAKAVYVYDVTTRTELYSKNSTQPLPLASLTKVMTTMVAAEAASSSTEVLVRASDLAQDGDSGLYVDERWRLSELLKFTLIVSSNDGASAVASAVGALNQSADPLQSNKVLFIKLMNQKAQDLGFVGMRFYNETGLDLSESQAGAYGSAQDVTKLLAHAVIAHPDIISVTRHPELTVTSNSDISHKAINTDILTSTVKGLIAGKTGYTLLAGGNLAVAFTASNGHTIVITVLGSTYDGRFKDVNWLIEASEGIL